MAQTGQARVIVTEDDLSSYVSSTLGAYVAGVAPLLRGNPTDAFLLTSPNDFLRRCTPSGRVTVDMDLSALEIMVCLGFTNKLWMRRAANNPLYGGSYIRGTDASGINFPTEFGFLDPTDNYDLNTVDGRPLGPDSVITVDSHQSFLTVSPAFWALVATGDLVTVSTTGVLPQPLAVSTNYYVHKSSVTNKIALCTSLQNANLNNILTLTSFGIGTHTVTISGKSVGCSVIVDSGADTLTVTAQFYAGAATGDRVQISQTGGALPGNVAASTNYYLIKSTTANLVQIANTSDEATSSPPIPVNFTSVGSGTIAIAQQDKSVTASTYTVDMSDDSLTTSSASFFAELNTGDSVTLLTDTGTLPAGLALATTYYAIKMPAPAVNKVKLATTNQNALNGVPITWDNPGSGTVELHNTSIQAAPSGNEKVLLFYGADPGKWNNDLSFKLTNFVTNSLKVKEPDSFLVEVYQGTSPVESFLCSRDPTKKDARGQTIYVVDVLKASSYIRAVDNVAIDPTVLPKDQLTLLSLAGGSDGDTVTDSTMLSALQAYDNPDDVPVSILSDFGWTTPAYQIGLAQLAESRGDCAFVIAPPFQVESGTDYVTQIANYKLETLNSVSSFGGMWAPHLKIVDRDNNRSVFVSPSGHVAGKVAYVWETFTPWTPIAGMLRGGLDVEDVHVKFKSGDMDYLYDSNVNPIRWRRGQGTVIWGQKTLQTRASDLDRFHVRLLLCVIKPNCKALLEQYLFSLNTVENDVGTRASIRSVLSNYMDGVKARNGVYDYRVICSTDNNSAQNIQDNVLNVWLLIKATKDAEYIQFTVGIVGYGTSFSIAESLI